MAKKPLGKDKFGVQKVMRKSDYFTDSLGQFSLNAMSGLVGQLTYFYTDKVGLAAGAVATMFLICKIVDAFTDIIMGNIVDHTKGKEKYRPWLIRMVIPVIVLIIALFTVPTGIGDTGKLAYMFLTNILLTAVVYTAICIPYASLMVVRTNSQEERGIMGTWRAAAGYVSGMVIAIGIIPITNMLGGNQSAWVKFGVGFALVAALGLLLCYARAKETAVGDKAAETLAETAEPEEAVPFKEALGKLFRNQYWVIILVMNFIANVTYGISGASGAYYCKWIYGNDNLTGILGAVGLIPTLVGFIAVGPMIKKLGVTKTLKVSFAIGMIATAVRIFNPTHFVFNTAMGCFASFANIPMMCLLGVMTAMAIDYNEYKYGKKMVAISQSASSFGSKIGSGIGASAVGWCLAIASYDGFAEVATPAVKQAIYTFGIYIPLVLFILMFAMTFKFDLEEKLPAYREEMAARKAAK